jgi:uncharacterized protein (TIGR02147 family)
MEQSDLNHISEILRDGLARKMKSDPNYSLRSLAKDLGISAGHASKVFNGKKMINIKLVDQLCELLDLSKVEKKLIYKIKYENHVMLNDAFEKYFKIKEDQFSILDDWAHLAILNLTTCDNFESSIDYISKKLGLPKLRVKNIIKRLLRLNFLSGDETNFKKSHLNNKFNTTQSHSLVRNFHRQMMKKADEELTQNMQEDFDKREISASTIAINVEKICLARDLIKKFQEDLASLLTQSPCTEVYQLNVQFFPLTKRVEKTNYN